MASDEDIDYAESAAPSAAESAPKEDQLKENPLEHYQNEKLIKLIEKLYKEEFKKKKPEKKKSEKEKPESRHWWQPKPKDSVATNKADGSFTERELIIGAILAKSYGYHDPPPETPDLESGKTKTLQQSSLPLSMVAENELLQPHEWAAYKVHQSPYFWDEPKDLLITILACCMASMTQGWDQVANGNLGWPEGLGVHITPQQTGPDIWKFGAVNAITWFSAAILGPFLVDPVCYSRFFGRRGSVFLAASFSFAATIGGSRATTWQGYLIARLFLGIGIGAKASIVPIWESECLPPAKRGRILVSWQFFTAIGIFAGSCATYIFRTNWRNQVLSGALPALILLILTYLTCESPRWLIIQGKYVQAFDTLVRLRKERILAAEEFCYIYFQIQTERAFSREKPVNFESWEDAIGYSKRLPKLVTIARNRRAAIATMIVMLSQQLSGINILAFLASIFFFDADLSTKSSTTGKMMDGLRFSIGFGAANALFSAIAYPLIEPLGVDPEENSVPKADDPGAVQQRVEAHKKKKRRVLYGRRALLLLSLGGGTVMLFILTFLLRLDKNNAAKLPLVMIFIILFTLFYSPGAGAVPFLYSAEVWPNEGREVGMSWGVFWNFLGSGFLALMVPRGFTWGSSKLFGLFTAFSFIGMVLVYFFVPSTDKADSLEEMSNRFKDSLSEFGLANLKKLKPFEVQWTFLRRKSEKAVSPEGPEAPTESQVPPSGAIAKEAATKKQAATEATEPVGNPELPPEHIEELTKA